MPIFVPVVSARRDTGVVTKGLEVYVQALLSHSLTRRTKVLYGSVVFVTRMSFSGHTHMCRQFLSSRA